MIIILNICVLCLYRKKIRADNVTRGGNVYDNRLRTATRLTFADGKCPRREFTNFPIILQAPRKAYTTMLRHKLHPRKAEERLELHPILHDMLRMRNRYDVLEFGEMTK